MTEEKRRRARRDAAHPAKGGQERPRSDTPPTNPAGKGNHRCPEYQLMYL